MNYTSNMGMNMPDEKDKLSIEHFNTNTQALDIVGKPDEYKNTKTYAVGDLCIHNNILYKCITAVETAEEFNAEKWEVTSLCKEEIANKTAIAELTEKILSYDELARYPYVNDDNVRVRTYPSIEHSKIITKYSTGKKVNVLEKTVNEKNELWYQIKVDDGQWGWMFGEYISFSEEYPASQVYEREFSKYGTFIEAFYYELFDIYLYGAPYTYENQNCLKKLLAGKSPASYSSYSSIANDDGKLYSTPTTIYEIDGCLIEVTGT